MNQIPLLFVVIEGPSRGREKRLFVEINNLLANNFVVVKNFTSFLCFFRRAIPLRRRRLRSGLLCRALSCIESFVARQFLRRAVLIFLGFCRAPSLALRGTRQRDRDKAPVFAASYLAVSLDTGADFSRLLSHTECGAVAALARMTATKPRFYDRKKY